MTNGQACASYKGDEKNYRIETPFKHKIKELDMFGLRFSFLFFSKFFLLFSERKKSIFFYHTFIHIVASFHTLICFTFNETMSFGGHGIYEWRGARGYRRLYTKQIIKKTLKPPKNPQGIQVRQDNSHLVPVSIKYLDSGGSSSLDLFYVVVALHFIGSRFETYVE